jgi:SAM-dependent methyltransferase
VTLFDTEEGCDQYEKMAEGYDGRTLIERMHAFVEEGARVLELGSGPGHDLKILSERYDVVGSDLSPIFVKRCTARVPGAKAFVLDAVTIATDEVFDAVFSNKVLQHLQSQDLARSFARQADVVRPGGVLFHTLWYGTKTEDYDGLLFVQHTEESVRAALPDALEWVDFWRYEEMEPDDSFVVVLRRRG